MLRCRSNNIKVWQWRSFIICWIIRDSSKFSKLDFSLSIFFWCNPQSICQILCGLHSSKFIPAKLLWYRVVLGDSMIVIHCCDSWSTIMMMIVLLYHRDSSRHGIWIDFYGVQRCFMQNILTLMVLGIWSKYHLWCTKVHDYTHTL